MRKSVPATGPMSNGKVTEDAGVFVLPVPSDTQRREQLATSTSPVEKQRKSICFDTDLPVISDDNPTVLSPEDIPDEYASTGKEAGLLVIFNHQEFIGLKSREGSQRDVKNLVDSFSRLRYEVRKDMIFEDLPKYRVEQKLKEIAQMDHRERNSLTIVFLTHGDKEGRLHCSDDECLTSEEIWMTFSASNCSTMAGKPKIFIFQACKGREKSRIAGIETDSMRVTAAKKNYTLPSEADILVAYSTLEGNVSYRHTEHGSWYIQELCNNLTAHGRREDIVSIMTRVSKCVAHHYTHEVYKQMPCFLSTLTSKFYLCPGKERGMFLQIIEQNKNMLKKIESVERALAAMDDKEKEKNERRPSKLSSSDKQSKKNSPTTQVKKPIWK